VADSLGGVVAEQPPRDGHHGRGWTPGGSSPSRDRPSQLQRAVVGERAPRDGTPGAPEPLEIPRAVHLDISISFTVGTNGGKAEASLQSRDRQLAIYIAGQLHRLIRVETV